VNTFNFVPTQHVNLGYLKSGASASSVTCFVWSTDSSWSPASCSAHDGTGATLEVGFRGGAVSWTMDAWDGTKAVGVAAVCAPPPLKQRARESRPKASAASCT